MVMKPAMPFNNADGFFFCLDTNLWHSVSQDHYVLLLQSHFYFLEFLSAAVFHLSTSFPCFSGKMYCVAFLEGYFHLCLSYL